MTPKKRYLRARKYHHPRIPEEEAETQPLRPSHPFLQPPPPIVQKHTPPALTQSKGPLPALRADQRQQTQQWIESMGEQVLIGEDNGAHTFWIDLKHEILGGLQIRVSTRHRQVSATILAPNTTIQTLIETRLVELKAMFLQKGIQVKQLSVRCSNKG